MHPSMVRHDNALCTPPLCTLLTKPRDFRAMLMSLPRLPCNLSGGSSGSRWAWWCLLWCLIPEERVWMSKKLAQQYKDVMALGSGRWARNVRHRTIQRIKVRLPRVADLRAARLRPTSTSLPFPPVPAAQPTYTYAYPLQASFILSDDGSLEDLHSERDVMVSEPSDINTRCARHSISSLLLT